MIIPQTTFSNDPFTNNLLQLWIADCGFPFYFFELTFPIYLSAIAGCGLRVSLKRFWKIFHIYPSAIVDYKFPSNFFENNLSHLTFCNDPFTNNLLQLWTADCGLPFNFFELTFPIYPSTIVGYLLNFSKNLLHLCFHNCGLHVSF